MNPDAIISAFKAAPKSESTLVEECLSIDPTFSLTEIDGIVTGSVREGAFAFSQGADRRYVDGTVAARQFVAMFCLAYLKGT